MRPGLAPITASRGHFSCRSDFCTRILWPWLSSSVSLAHSRRLLTRHTPSREEHEAQPCHCDGEDDAGQWYGDEGDYSPGYEKHSSPPGVDTGAQRSHTEQNPTNDHQKKRKIDLWTG